MTTRQTLMSTLTCTRPRVFPTSLKGATLHWYTQLPAESIDSFSTLIRRFTAQYATSRPHHTTSTTLANLRQNDDEPLRTFMERFSNISVRIRNLNPEVALHSMLMALKVGPFVDSLYRDPAPRPRGRIHPDGGALRLPQPEEASNNNLLALPPPGHTPNNADKSKHCRYHRNHGHTTEECRTLRDRIEELIQAGHLGQYIQRQQGNRGGYGGRGRGRGRGSGARTESHPGSRQNAGGAEISQETESAPLRGVINTIAGGFAGGGASSSTRRRHLRSINCVHSTTPALHQSSPPISFSDKDYVGVSPNQDDPMVIVVEIANSKVQKTLIDQGSSADVLYWPTFLKLDVPHSLIQPYMEPLVGFAGERVHTRGYVDLLTTFGTPPDTRRVMDGKIIAVKANQETARQCYVESLKISSSSKQSEGNPPTIAP
ncbi:uncharacterized protein LOC109817925 [Cajanus cajan]|uniref:uncharacterized protein LOC109817925 n=1 Tax=Cajanus cajan TaxID=3821 RepID=UPI00098DC79A|nr:uncharacterized protein LOC109817925 [Cajanus cajan]